MIRITQIKCLNENEIETQILKKHSIFKKRIFYRGRFIEEASMLAIKRSFFRILSMPV